jgi:predicted solute-binding protein
MVFAVWAGKREFLTAEAGATFMASYRFGMANLDEIVLQAAAERGFPAAVAREYLTRHIVYQLSERHLRGLALYRQYVRRLEPMETGRPV